MIYFTSDTHFGDPRVLRIDKRPFKTMTAHDEALIRFWNEVVQADDEVWHFGDFARGGPTRVTELLSILNGRKHLVVGNNDGPETVGSWLGQYSTLCREYRRRVSADLVSLSIPHLEQDGQEIHQPAWPLARAPYARPASVRRRCRCSRPSTGIACCNSVREEAASALMVTRLT